MGIVCRIGAVVSLVVSLVFGVLAPASAEYPDRVVTVMVGFPPGAVTDMMARSFAATLQQETGQTVVVENKPGASGQVASRQVARSAPDGYTLMVVVTHHLINQAIYPNLPYDTEKDFTPIANFLTTPLILVVGPDAPYNNLKEYLEAARKSGTMQFGSSGTGSGGHMSGELLSSLSGVPLTHVPYRGGAPLVTDVMGGHVQSAISDPQILTPLIRSGKVKALGVTSKERSPALPDIPTFAEQGVPGFETEMPAGLLGPANMPADIVAKLNKIALKSTSTPAAQEFMQKFSAVASTLTPEQYKAYLHEAFAKWKKVARERRIEAK